jgi:hypothetical protein
MGYKGVGATLKIDKADFTREILASKARGELTSKATDYFIKLASHAIKALSFTDPRDREDCIQFALLDLLLYWRNFDPLVSNNAFAFFTSVTFNGYAKGFKKIHKNSGVDQVSLDHVGDAEIYSI